MKTLLLTSRLLLAVLLTGCTTEELLPPVKKEKGNGDTHITLSLSAANTRAAADENETLNITSMRVIIFQGNELVTQTLIAGDKDTEPDDKWIITSTQPINTFSGLSTVYVILNEPPANWDWNTVAEDKLIAFYETALSYEPVNKGIYGNELWAVEEGEERPFSMVVFDEIWIPTGHTTANPFRIDLTGEDGAAGFPIERPMAKLTLTEVTNRHFTDGTKEEEQQQPGYAAKYKETSLIFILEMGLTRIPAQYSWTPTWKNNNGIVSKITLPAYSGTYHDRLHFYRKDFAEYEAGYYFQSWNGSIELVIDGIVRETQRPKDGGRVYWAGDNSSAFYSNRDEAINILGRNGNDIRTLASGLVNELNIAGLRFNGQNVTIDHLRQATANPAMMDQIRNVARVIGTQGNGIHSNVSPTHFGAAINSMFNSPPGVDYIGVGWEFENGDGVEMNVGGAIWTLNDTPMSFYVPEHILSNNSVDNAKSLYVKAAQVTAKSIAQSGFERPAGVADGDPSWTLTPFSIPQYKSADQSKYSDGWIREQAIVSGTNTDPLALWSFELVEKGGVTYVLHYWTTGATRWRYLDAEGVMDFDFQNISTAAIVDYGVKETFTMPVSNAGFTDGNAADFNIYRNREYHFSLHATRALQGVTVRSAGIGQPHFMALKAK
jgi:hypothetical protein